MATAKKTAEETASTVEPKETAVAQPAPVQVADTYKDKQGTVRIAGPKQPKYETPSLDPDPEQVKRAKAREKS